MDFSGKHVLVTGGALRVGAALCRAFAAAGAQVTIHCRGSVAEAERLAAEKAEAERLAAEKAEAERLAAEQAEAERLAAEEAEEGDKKKRRGLFGIFNRHS